MAKTLPSKIIYSADVPEPTKPEVQFKYNFFVQDEGLEAGGVKQSYLEMPSESFDAKFISSTTTKIPKYNLIKWKPVSAQKNVAQVQYQKLISKNLDKIVSEDDLCSYDYFSVLLDKPNLSSEIANLFSSSITLHASSTGSSTSPLKLSSYLNDNLEKQLDQQFLSTIFAQPKVLNAKFYDNSGAPLDQKSFDIMNSLGMQVQLNGNIANKLIQNSVKDPFSPYSQELNELLNQTSKLANYQKNVKSLSDIDSDDFDAMIDYVEIVENKNYLGGEAIVIGYIIDKIEHLSDGTVKVHNPIIIENPKVGLTIDFNIKYGSTYSYAVKSIALVTTQAVEDDNNEVFCVKFLISSKSSKRIVIDCIEEKAPPCANDIQYNWNYETDKLVIHWNFPVNYQRDIKGFQIFRRDSVDAPFELLKYYDFNDSLVKNDQTVHNKEDNIRDDLIEKMTSPKTFFIDDDFGKSSKYIYTICSIDAHGLSSNYSCQMEISFDLFKNKLIKKLISHSGAPKQYPNLYLEADLFKDSITVGGVHSKKLKVYLTPEMYTLIDDQGNKSNMLLTTKLGGKYIVQFINVDKQKLAKLEIDVNDRS